MSNRPSVKTLMNLPITKEQAKELHRKMESLDPYEVMMQANKYMAAHGVEVIRSANYWKAYYGDIIAEYVNMGDSYILTLIYDNDRDSFYVTAWGDYVETQERNGRIKDPTAPDEKRERSGMFG
jgi:hypothetical protein